MGARVVMARAQCGCGCPCSAKLNRKQWYNKLYARMISSSTAKYNQLLDARKRQLLALVMEDSSVKDVLEIGVGSGANLPYYAQRKDLQLTGVDPNPEMLPYLTATCQELAFPLDQLTFRQGLGEALPLPDASQDVVISTLMMCSVGDQRAVLSEVLRVLRPGGSFLFMEHVAAPLGSWGRSLQELVNPAWKVIADGCHVNRETWNAIRSADFSSCDMTHFQATESPLFTLIAPHICGRAVK